MFDQLAETQLTCLQCILCLFTLGNIARRPAHNGACHPFDAQGIVECPNAEFTIGDAHFHDALRPSLCFDLFEIGCKLFFSIWGQRIL